MRATVESKMFLVLGENDSDVEVLVTAECCYVPERIRQSWPDSTPEYSSYDLLSIIVIDPCDSEFKQFEDVELTDKQYGLVKDRIWSEFMENYS